MADEVEKLDKQTLKMTMFASRVSGWARLQQLRNKDKTVFIQHAPPEEIGDLKMLEDWWASIGLDNQENIKRIAKEMAIDVTLQENMV